MTQIAAKWGVGKPGADKPLQEHINWYVKQGYRIVSQTETAAQLVRPKQFSMMWFLLGLLAVGVGAVLYIIYYAIKKDKAVYLTVVDGVVKAT